MNIEIIDDFLSSYHKNFYINLFTNHEQVYPWYFVNDLNHRKYKGNFYFCNIVYDMDQGVNYPQQYPLYESILNRLNITMSNVRRIKANLYPLSGRRIHHQSHTDYKPNRGLRTCLYYPTPSNRFTIFDGKKRIRCKENRAIIFDGSIRHHSTTPTDVNCACSVNIDYWV